MTHQNNTATDSMSDGVENHEGVARCEPQNPGLELGSKERAAMGEALKLLGVQARGAKHEWVSRVGGVMTAGDRIMNWVMSGEQRALRWCLLPMAAFMMTVTWRESHESKKLLSAHISTTKKAFLSPALFAN